MVSGRDDSGASGGEGVDTERPLEYHKERRLDKAGRHSTVLEGAFTIAA